MRFQVLSAKSLKAREKVASLGTAAPWLQPHRRRSGLNERLANTALALKARASAARSACGRPGKPRQHHYRDE